MNIMKNSGHFPSQQQLTRIFCAIQCESLNVIQVNFSL